MQETNTKSTGRRVLVIGLDGATWDLMQPWIDAGKLPDLSRDKPLDVICTDNDDFDGAEREAFDFSAEEEEQILDHLKNLGYI